MSQQDLEKLVEADIGKVPLGGDAETQAQQQFWSSMGVRIERRAEQPNPAPVTGKEASLEKLLGVNVPKNFEGQSEQQANREGLTWQKTNLPKPNLPKPGQATDIFEQMKKQFSKSLDLTVGKPKEGLELPGEADKTLVLPKVGVNESKPGVTPAEFAKAYKSFATYSNDKFNQHMRAAEDFMKQGRFYRAADAYTLASIFKPDDPLGYAGKSLALFGSGEYLSSSLFLARALEIFPEYAKVKVDLVGMIGDKDTVENRILEAREWMDKSGSGELEFLLSYIYYQMDRLEFARQSIEAAAKKMPDSPAVAAMKKAIDERLAKP
jgi:tetratricopeptide (TPR) repeat protein